MSIDLESIVAIDVHTHAQVPRNGAPDPITMHVLDAAAKHFRSDFPRPNAEEVAAYYRDRKMAAVIFCVDSEANTGEVPVPNDEVLEIAAANDDVLIPFVSVDPHRGKRGVSEVKRLIEKGARGFKFHPNLQGFFPNERLAYPLYEVIAEAGLPALFHTGHSGMGQGCRAVAVSGSSTRTRSTSTTSRSTSRACRSSWPTRPFRGRKRRSRSRCTRRRSTSISRAGRRSYSRRCCCSTRTGRCVTRCSSGPTIR